MQDELPYDMNDYYREMDEVKKNSALFQVKYLLKIVDKLKIDTLKWSSGLTGVPRVNPKHEEVR